MKLNEIQKVKIMEAIRKYKPELYMELKNIKVDDKNNEDNEGPKELSDEELATVGGGVSFLDLDFDLSRKIKQIVKDIFGMNDDEVQGPKVDLKQCSLCGQLVPGNSMVDHLIDHHAEEIINNREIF